ncbi:GHKL domain-containing protein [Clostridium sp. CCUG 7971]|uniref:sensor histidine kinase n=1 Tax=Clostridium sp. CCUG 7971 TaxID=2811414 RepID=UPI001ABA7A45|nr:GHKL domain-containing protein [Clostridium sp. CCUG 7971]MBO3444238.1 GHKL domain-containing protein [Clostridium sp. CCUG 7971]
MAYIYTILAYIGMVLAFINIYSLKVNKFLIIIYSFVIYVFLLIAYKYLGISPLYVGNIVMSFIIYKFTKKISLTIIVPLSTTLLSMVVNIVCYNIHFDIFNISICKDNNILNIGLYYIINYLLLFLLARYINKLIMRNIEKFNVKIQTMIILTSILVLTIYLETIRQIKLLSIEDINQPSGRILLILYFITFIAFLFLVSMVNNENRLKEINEYNKKLEIMTNEMKKFRHDYKNILLSMNGYMQENDMEGLKEFFYSNIEPLSENLNSYNFNITSVSNIKNIELKGLILSKLIKAEELGINININIYKNIKNINMNVVDLCRVLGIILDNCIEASLECKKPNIDICIDRNSSCTYFLISNTYIKKIDSLAELIKGGTSTKGINRGIGLSNLNEILDKYEDICFSIKLDENFIQKLEIYS